MESHDLGEYGEELAVRHLISKGYSILERNWRHAKAEVDIIALRGDILAVVEVKSRSSEAFGDPLESVSREKIRLLRKAINAYVNLKGIDLEIRFELIGIIFEDDRQRIRHVEDACYLF